MEELDELQKRRQSVRWSAISVLKLDARALRRHGLRARCYQGSIRRRSSRTRENQVRRPLARHADISIKETELNEKLQDVYGKLLAAGADKRQNEREVKLQEVLSSLKRVFPGVRGRLVDLCQPTSKKYERAVTTVLGRNLDAIIVDHEKVAIECIDFLRNQRAGQATFIPLDTIQVKPIQEKYRNFVKGARLAVDCLEYGADIERAIQHACGSSLICDTMAVAKQVCYDKGQEVKGKQALWILLICQR
jgi:structural maintenance of chromosome 1